MVVAHDHLEQLVALCGWGIHETNACTQSKFYTAGNQLYLCSSPFAIVFAFGFGFSFGFSLPLPLFPRPLPLPRPQPKALEPTLP